MTVVTSLRYVYYVSRAFGLFPWEPTSRNSFLYSERDLSRGRVILIILIVVRVAMLALDLKFNMHPPSKMFMTLFRSANNAYLTFLTAIIYKSIFKFGKSTCEWLNKMNALYSSIQGNENSLYSQHRFLVFYSLTFFIVTNTLTVAGFLSNNKFISGAIATADCGYFILLLAFQNLFICQLLAFLQLIRLSYSRLNEILKDGDLQRMQGIVLKYQLKRLRVCHLVITEFFDFLNSFFELHMLFYIFWSFCSTVFCSVSVVTFEFNDSIVLLLWMHYHIFQNGPMLYLCESVSTESKLSAQHIHVLMIQNADLDIKEEVEILSLQVQHMPADFSVCGFFNLNFKLFLTVGGVAVTYIITFIQIKPTEILGVNGTSVDF